MTSGIYKITNKVNGKIYIGESFDIERRWKEHIDDLNNNNHHSNKLQNDWNTYGKDNFKFEIIRDVTNDMISSFNMELVLLVYEDIYIKEYDSINNGYNIEETLRKIFNGERTVNTEQLKGVHLNALGSMINTIIKNIEENNGKYYSKQLKAKSKPIKVKKINNKTKLEIKQSKEDFKNEFNLIEKFEGFTTVNSLLGNLHINIKNLFLYLKEENILDEQNNTTKEYSHIKSIKKMFIDKNGIEKIYYSPTVDYVGLCNIYEIILSDYNNFVYKKYLS